MLANGRNSFIKKQMSASQKGNPSDLIAGIQTGIYVILYYLKIFTGTLAGFNQIFANMFTKELKLIHKFFFFNLIFFGFCFIVYIQNEIISNFMFNFNNL